MKDYREKLLIALKILYVVCSFGFIDVWLRVLTRWLNMYNIYELAPNLFTLCWAIVLSIVVLIIPHKLIGRVVYAGLYFLNALYAVIQYGYYLIFGKFLYLSDFMFAGEGADYTAYVLEILNVRVVIEIIILVGIGIVGIIIFPKAYRYSWKKLFFSGVMFFFALCIMCFLPNLYKDSNKTDLTHWEAFANPEQEYERFVNSAFDMQLTGLYQYFARDTFLNIEKRLTPNKIEPEKIEVINSYFSEKECSSYNEMTGIYANKNIIIVMMESIDDWLVTERDMPTVYYMMENGICFDDLYTPDYSTGYTFNTEFGFNTSVYPFSNGNVAYTLVENDFGNSIANVFKKNGYTVNSFHFNSSNFYNRSAMHEAFGYEKYHSFYDYDDNIVNIQDDSYLYMCDELYEDLTSDMPFMSFVISYSAHLTYDAEAEFSQYALEKYPEYAQGEITEEDIIRAKARMTDDMFSGLLKRLEEDGLLEDTVIVGYADHYSYGITDEEFLQRVSEEAGNSILENTPAFIYCASMEDKAMVVDKVMQITDLAPTIENMFGFDVPKEIMGSDIFDENYEGYAIFPNNTWVTNQAYMKNGVMVYNNGMTDDEILEMNKFVQQTYVVNDYILECDYYGIEQ